MRRTIQSGISLAFAVSLMTMAVVLSTSTVTGAQEASPETMDEATPTAADSATVASVLWQLDEFVDLQGNSMTPEAPALYSVQFLPDNLVAIQADCNRSAGSFESDGSSLSLSPLATTLALCGPESFGDDYLRVLQTATGLSLDQSEATDQLVIATEEGTLTYQPSLTGVTWEWESFLSGDGSTLTPDDPASYSLEFLPDGSIQGQVDCNRGVGQYTADGNSISITLATTRKACQPDSLDGEFGRFVMESNSFVIRDGQLALALPMDGGITVLNPVVDLP